MSSNKLRPLGYLLLLAFAGGSVSTFTKLSLRTIPPFGFTFLRLLIGTIIAYAMLRVIGKKTTWSHFKLFAPVATFWWMNALIFTLGLWWTTPTTAQFIHISIPIITAIIAGFILKERINKRQWLGILIAAFGVAIVIFSNGQLSLTSTSLVGNLLVLSSALVFSFYAVGSRQLKFKQIHAFEMNFIVAACGIIASLPLALWEYSGNQWIGSAQANSWLTLVVASAGLGVFYGGFQLLINKFGPAYATLNLYLLPGFVIIWSSLLLDERLNISSLIGAAIALVGVWFVTSSAKSRKAVLPNTPE